ncbi:type VI-A CRISPR-associated RNA-guided ribonuclease Cas13a [uncultured Tateyamaria sp.]|uniref:type VI-A CRISPR-associated RNA-guided ribonuclease Cas13a n=1 Tax=uncultured Tateyamaria sp. TaxID=455651 RepID=UPI00262DCB0C|nr:type VI-A CRISPR-associated RNA-guided ribonuclease Cas13a [uncultured Tateyamaria sp.]
MVISQWISTIDKIASKPFGSAGATQRQRDFRERLGAASLDLLERRADFAGFKGERAGYFQDLWKLKIHPYGKRNFRPRQKNEKEPKSEGRLFHLFTESSSTDDADVAQIAANIYKFLYVNEKAAKGSARKDARGRILHRARSISKNTLERRPVELVHKEWQIRDILPFNSTNKEDLKVNWTEEDKRKYASAGDANVASKIYSAALALENPGGRFHRPQRVTMELAGKALYEHWSHVFRRGGKVLNMREANEDPEFDRLVVLHNEIRDTYARILKRHRKGRPENRKGRARESQRPVSALLPKNMKELFKLMERHRRNRSLSDHVRFGKILYYARHFERGSDNANFDDYYWGSKGQSEIKRTEAFVRTWRNTLVLASRTLKDWVDPDFYLENQPGSRNTDILGKWRSIGSDLAINEARMTRKLDLLFGNRINHFPADHAVRLGILKQVVKEVSDVRNSVYHFKGRDSFVSELEALGTKALNEEKKQTNYLEGVDQAIWEDDCRGQHSVLLASLNAANISHFANEQQAKQLINTLSRAKDGYLPLPRFSRLLNRTKDAWSRGSDGKPNLPEPVHRVDLEVPGRRCQYVSMKLLYDRSFKVWLENRSSKKVTTWINKAVERATKAARSMNSKQGEIGFEIIVSRAESLRRPGKGEGIGTFFRDLTAATASEMRVQRGYQSDAENAKKQASYIEDLKCDVLALAFSDYLHSSGFSWLQKFDASRPLWESGHYELDHIETTTPNMEAEPWQRRLYFLLHLIPVDEVNRLLHELARWEVASRAAEELPVEEIGRLKSLRRVLVLYIDMHDAKYSGGAALAGCSDFKHLFENEAAYSAVFPPGDAGEESRVPRRGLREIARYGNLAMLENLFAFKPITLCEVQKTAEMERSGTNGKSNIAKLHAAREQLHAAWVKNKRIGLPAEKVRSYVELIKDISKHRQISNRLNLIEHVRAHKIMMSVIGRLVDYAGLFERDLKFVTLSILHDMQMTPAEIFKEKGLSYFDDGRIFQALDNIKGAQGTKEEKAKSELRDRLKKYFTDVCDTENPHRRFRNKLAHLEVFAPDASLDLTELVNGTRQMMAYDRKLKNAVSQSIREVLEREGFDLRWKMSTDGSVHKLVSASLQVRKATHLGRQKLTERDKHPKATWPKKHSIEEALHGFGLSAAVARAFSGTVVGHFDISKLDLDKIDFAAIDRELERKKNSAKGQHQKRPHRGGKRPRRNRKPQQPARGK